MNKNSNAPTHNPHTFDGFDSANEIWESKVGYDSANKRMVAKVYKHLYNVMEFTTKPSWTAVIREMLIEDNKLGKVSLNGYYSTIRKNLKDIGVCYYSPVTQCMVKGRNWNRFFGDEDWSWFKTNTNSGGYGIIEH